jgi:hypothetical protein
MEIRPIGESEYQSWRATLVKNYAAEKQKECLNEADALRDARKEGVFAAWSPCVWALHSGAWPL